MVGPLFVKTPMQVSQVGGGGFFCWSAAPAQDRVCELLCVLVGGVAASTKGRYVDVVAVVGGGRAVQRQVGDVESTEVVFGEAVGVVVRVWRRFVKVVGGVDVVAVEVEFLVGGRWVLAYSAGWGMSGSMVAA